MPSFESSISIDAPRESVWRVLHAVHAWPEWLPTVSGVQPLDGEALQPGRRYTVRQPRLRPATWVVTVLEPARRFVWQTRSPGLRMLADHRIDERPAGGSQLTLRFSFDGALGPAMGWLFRSVTERYLAEEAAALKRKVEAQA